MHMCVCVCICVRECQSPWRPEALYPPRAGVTSHPEPLDWGVRNWSAFNCWVSSSDPWFPVFLYLFILRQSPSVAWDGYLLCSPGWLLIPVDPSASLSWGLRLDVWAPMLVQDLVSLVHSCSSVTCGLPTPPHTNRFLVNPWWIQEGKIFY